MLNLDETFLIECIFLRSEKEALDPLPAAMAGRWRAAGRFVNVMLDEQACARGGGAVSGDQRRANANERCASTRTDQGERPSYFPTDDALFPTRGKHLRQERPPLPRSRHPGGKMVFFFRPVRGNRGRRHLTCCCRDGVPFLPLLSLFSPFPSVQRCHLQRTNNGFIRPQPGGQGVTNGGDTTVRDASTNREEEETLYRQLGSGLRCEGSR